MKLLHSNIRFDELSAAGRAGVHYIDHLFDGHIRWVEVEGDEDDLYQALHRYVIKRSQYGHDLEENRIVISPIIDRLESLETPRAQSACYLSGTILGSLKWPERALIFARRAYAKAKTEDDMHFAGHHMKLLAIRLELAILLQLNSEVESIQGKLFEYVNSARQATISDHFCEETWRKLSELDIDRGTLRTFLIGDWANLIGFQREREQDMSHYIAAIEAIIDKLPAEEEQEIDDNDPEFLAFEEERRNAPVYRHDWSTFEGGTPPPVPRRDPA